MLIRGKTASRSALLALAGILVERHDFGAEQRQLAFAGQVALEAVELFAEVGHVLERAVHGGEPHVGPVVELAQLGHHELAYPARGPPPRDGPADGKSVW